MCGDDILPTLLRMMMIAILFDSGLRNGNGATTTTDATNIFLIG